MRFSAYSALTIVTLAAAESITFTATSDDGSINGPLQALHDGSASKIFALGGDTPQVMDLNNGVAGAQDGIYPFTANIRYGRLSFNPQDNPTQLQFDGDKLTNANFFACLNVPSSIDWYQWSTKYKTIYANDVGNNTLPFPDCTPVTITKSSVPTETEDPTSSTDTTTETSVVLVSPDQATTSTIYYTTTCWTTVEGDSQVTTIADDSTTIIDDCSSTAVAGDFFPESTTTVSAGDFFPDTTTTVSAGDFSPDSTTTVTTTYVNCGDVQSTSVDTETTTYDYFPTSTIYANVNAPTTILEQTTITADVQSISTFVTYYTTTDAYRLEARAASENGAVGFKVGALAAVAAAVGMLI